MKISLNMNNLNDDLQITTSTRGKTLLIFNDFVYNFMYQNDVFTSWRCKKRKCPGNIRVYNNGEKIIKNHNHEGCETEKNKILQVNKCIYDAENTNYNNKEIFYNNILKNNIEVQVKRNSLYKTLSNRRKKNK